MADDLDEEWWKQDDDQEEASEEESREEERGVKRAAPVSDTDSDSEDEASSSEESAQQPAVPAGKRKGSKKKKKKGRGKFIRKKITSEDEENLKRGGIPEDVKALLRPSIAVARTDSCGSESDDEDELSAETDFFPANQQLASGDYLSEVLPGWGKVVTKAKLTSGSPLILILCSSAIRAVQLNRELKSFLGKDCKTAKLFAKHMKLEEQKKFLQKKVCHACIGTPNRVQALLEAECLKLERLHAVVLDWNWRDVKLKRMVDIPDVRRDLTVLLKEFVVDRVKCTPCRIAIL